MVLFSMAKKSAVTVLAMPNTAQDSESAAAVRRRLRLGLRATCARQHSSSCTICIVKLQKVRYLRSGRRAAAEGRGGWQRRLAEGGGAAGGGCERGAHARSA